MVRESDPRYTKSVNTSTEQPQSSTEKSRRVPVRVAFGSSLNFFVLTFAALVLMLTLGHAQIAGVLMASWLAVFLLVGCGVVPHWLLNALQIGLLAPPPLKAGEHIVVALLGDGTVSDPTSGASLPAIFGHSRIAAAARLYREAKSAGNECAIIVAGDDSAEGESPPIYLTALMTLGVEKSDVQFGRGTNTYAHARAISEMLCTRRFDRLLLVTSGLHVKRAALYFHNVGLKPIIVPSDFASVQFAIFPNGYNFAMTDIACHQLIGMVRMRVYNKLGWNK